MNLDTPQSPGPELPPPPPPPAAPPVARAAPRTDGVSALLAAVRARQHRALWAQGGLLGGLATLALITAGGLLGQVAPRLAQGVLWLALPAGAAIACALGIVRARRQVGDDARIARLVGQRRPELSLDVLAAVELAHGRGTAGSSDLTEAFLRQMDLRARTVDARAIVDTRPVRRTAMAAAAGVLVLALVLGFFGSAWVAGLARIRAVSRQPATAARAEPITGDIELTYRYPAYTGLSPRTVPGTNGEVSAPAGTEVVLKTRSDRPVERAEIVVNDQTLPLRVTGERELEGSFVAKQSGHYHFVFYRKGARPEAVGPDIALNVEADKAPQVTLLTPASEVEVDPGQKVTLKFEATDDYGLSSLALVFRTPGAAQDTRIPLPREDGRRSRGTYAWDLGSLKVNPGDRVTYYVEAQDNDAVEGPKKGVSRTQALRIYSAAEHLRAALEKTEALWGRMVDHLADRLEGPDRAKQKDVQAVAAAQAVDARGQQLATDMRMLSRDLAREKDAPKELLSALSNISAELQRHVAGTMDFRRLYLRTQRARGEDWGTGARLTGMVNEEIDALERDILYLESLLDRQKLEALQELAKQMAGERRELSRLIEQFKSNPDEAARQQVMQQIQQLKGRIQELMQRMAELRKGIRDEHLNSEALSEMMKDEDMQGALDNVERLMREGKADEALAKLQELGMKMDEMLNNLDDAQNDFGSEQYPELAEKFSKFMEDLKGTAEEQQKVAEQTKALRDQARSQNRDRLAEKGQALKDELLRKVQQAQESYQKLPAERLNGRAARPLEEAQSELRNVENALKVNDFDLAAESAARAEDAARQLSAMGEQQRQLDEMFGNPPEVRQQSSQLAEQLEKDARGVEDVSRKLQSLFPPPGSQLSQQERQQLQQLSQRQQQLEQRAQGLRQQMEDMEQTAPLFGEEAGKQMEDVGRRMGEASERMAGKDPGRGYGEQQAAMEGLKRFQQQMQQSQQGKKGGRGLPLPMGMGRRQEGNGRDPKEKVELPDEDSFQAPKEFRKDLLDAMKQGAPEKYREQVKRYYEELVK
ncbi:DUF4175 domain-containing protein [Corallococcus sp. H22C18031201]|uniref:DUF4175 family protein n=1 Tax=Citreicoccus inhibens TaxID=2849499 RepID=UPI000E72A603|nr:DUF4175 family protein [Citreicoccus inhibens]MBU8898915.1 DUF4175 family protein [Citreicoccus inhibens]RJS18502.1 DUF4175 domain-containing protein [Corallococcus sp. H22C18031201]